MSWSFRLVSPSSETKTIHIEPKAIASGADGAIHRIISAPGMVAKLYHAPEKAPERLAKLKAMLANPPDLPAIETDGKRFVQIAWPIAWIEAEDGRFSGYAMPEVDLSRSTPLENLLARKTRTHTGLPESYGFRLSAAANLAGLIAQLHARGHYVIDLKPINLNVYHETFYISVLDCDGFSVSGADGARFHAHQFSEGYICPEALQRSLAPQQLGVEQDHFALAVIIFQLLNQGLHPYQGVPGQDAEVPPTNDERVKQHLYAYGTAENALLRPSPWSVHRYFDDETRVLFDRAFTRPLERPSAEEWHDHLIAYANPHGGKAHTCEHNREHVHFFKGCPWCAFEPYKAETRLGKRRPRAESFPARTIPYASKRKPFPVPAYDRSRNTRLESVLLKDWHGSKWHPPTRLLVAENIAEEISQLHARGHGIVDIARPESHSGILRRVVLEHRTLKRGATPMLLQEYLAPEIQESPPSPELFGEAQERFVLAVLMFQLVNLGLHPYDGIVSGGELLPKSVGQRIKRGLYPYGLTKHPSIQPYPWSFHEFLDDATRRMFDRAFTTRGDRPSAQEWHSHIRGKLSRASMCRASNAHFRLPKGCPWCAMGDDPDEWIPPKPPLSITKKEEMRNEPTSPLEDPTPAESQAGVFDGLKRLLRLTGKRRS